MVSHDPWLFLHIGEVFVALAVGSFQFSRLLRTHTSICTAGRDACTWLQSPSWVASFRMALESYGGSRLTSALACLAVLWLFHICHAYVRIRQRNIQSHREWMIAALR